MRFLIIFLSVLSIALTACDDDDNFTPIGTTHIYQTSEAGNLEDGTYVVNSAEEYVRLMDARLPSDLNVDFKTEALVIVKGHETSGIDDISVQGSRDISTYNIGISMSLNCFSAIEHWCVAVVMPAVANPSVVVDIERNGIQ